VTACGGLELRTQTVRGTLAKYKMLDLRFATAHPVLLANDRINRKTLEDLALFPTQNDESTTEIADKYPTCIEDLIQDAKQGTEWVKVFLDIWPRRNALMEYMQALMKAQQDRIPNPSASAFSKLMDEADQMFPSQFQISDACITNSDFVWFHKHFYM